MIIFQTKKPVESLTSNCVGVTGDNLAHTQEFYIKGIYDGSLTYSLHLRFADGSVNIVTPDSVQHDGEGTGLRWVVKKNDIFMHGYFELQIEGRNDEGLVFQTEIIELYADESIPVEDKEYENPNSETLRLRDEAYEAMQTLSEQQATLEANAQLLEKYDLNNKLDDKENVIATAHIKNYAVTTDKLYDGAVTNEKIEYGAVGESELSTELSEKINSKLDNAEGSVQTLNLASKAVTAEKIADGAITSRKLANGSVSANTIASYQIGTAHIIGGSITQDKLSDAVNQSISSKAEKSTTLSGYGITDAYTKTEADTLLSGKLDNSEGSVKTENIANGAVTTEKIAIGSVTSIKIANDAVTSGAILNGNVTKEKLASDIIQLINSKYDASNVETGSGQLTISEAYADKINSASFDYQKTGDWVNIHVYVDFKEFTPVNSSVSITLSGLPYVCKNSVTPREMCVTTLKKQMLWGVIPNTAGLTLLLFNANTFTENEKLSYSITYKIA